MKINKFQSQQLNHSNKQSFQSLAIGKGHRFPVIQLRNDEKRGVIYFVHYADNVDFRVGEVSAKIQEAEDLLAQHGKDAAKGGTLARIKTILRDEFKRIIPTLENPQDLSKVRYSDEVSLDKGLYTVKPELIDELGKSIDGKASYLSKEKAIDRVEGIAFLTEANFKENNTFRIS